MLAQDGLDVNRIELAAATAEPVRNPLRLGRELGLLEVLLAACPVEEDDGDEPAAGDEADEEQPPLELGHQCWPPVRRIGASLRGSAAARRYTPRP